MENFSSEISEKEKLTKEEIEEQDREEIEELIEKEIEYAETIEYTSKGRAIIEVGIKNQEDFFSPYCVKGDEVIHPGVSEYIVDQALNLSPNEDIQIDIYAKTMISEEIQEKMITSIRRNFADDVATINTKLRRNTKISLSLFLAGSLFQVLFVISIIFNWSVIIETTVELIAWVFLWEAMNTFCVIRISEIITRRRYVRLVGASVKFYLNDN